MTERPETAPDIRVAPALLEGPGEPLRLEVELPAGLPESVIFLVDVYDHGNPVHPEGHIGWWARSAWDLGKFTLTFDMRAPSPDQVRMEPEALRDPWTHAELDLAAVESADVHLVLRDDASGEILVDRPVLWLRSERAAAGARRMRRRVEEAPDYVRDLAKPELRLAGDACVHVVAVDIRAGDAVGNLALDAACWLGHHGIRARLWARHFEIDAAGVIEDVEELRGEVGERDLIFYQHSIFDPSLGDVLAAPCAKLGFFQGITPAEWIEPFDAEAAEACRRGLAQLPQLAGFDGLLVGSAFTGDLLAGALADGAAAPIAVCPPALNLARFDATPGEPLAPPVAERFLLYVGRFAPHKKIEDLIAIFAAYRTLDPGCGLVLAGSFTEPGYRARVAARIAALPPEAAVHFVEAPSDGRLAALYRACTAYVSASEHEGFCVPLAEAMGFHKPVFARDVPAVRETLGGAGHLFGSAAPAETAAALYRVLRDPGESERFVARQDERLATLRRAADGAILGAAMARAYARVR